MSRFPRSSGRQHWWGGNFRSSWSDRSQVSQAGGGRGSSETAAPPQPPPAVPRSRTVFESTRAALGARRRLNLRPQAPFCSISRKPPSIVAAWGGSQPVGETVRGANEMFGRGHSAALEPPAEHPTGAEGPAGITENFTSTTSENPKALRDGGRLLGFAASEGTERTCGGRGDETPNTPREGAGPGARRREERSSPKSGAPAAGTSDPEARTSVPAAGTSDPAARTSGPAARTNDFGRKTLVPREGPVIPRQGSTILAQSRWSRRRERWSRGRERRFRPRNGGPRALKTVAARQRLHLCRPFRPAPKAKAKALAEAKGSEGQSVSAEA